MTILPTIIPLMKERDHLQKVASGTQSREAWIDCKAVRNRSNNRLKYEQRNWEKAWVEECDGNPSKTWNILNWKTAGSPKQLFNQGRLINKPHELPDAQNQYFIDEINLYKRRPSSTGF